MTRDDRPLIAAKPMTLVLGLAVLLCSVPPTHADVIELKTGERIEGTLKQATPASVSVELGGQTITFEGEKVRTIYFGTAPSPQGPKTNGPDGLAALKSLTAATRVGLSYREYSRRVLDTKPSVDRWIGGSADAAEKTAATQAMALHVLASRAWRARIVKDGFDAVARDPALSTCEPAKKVLESAAKRDGFALDNSGWVALTLGSEGIPALWACAADKTAEAEKHSRAQ
jgi:hypothetical protein